MSPGQSLGQSSRHAGAFFPGGLHLTGRGRDRLVACRLRRPAFGRLLPIVLDRTRSLRRETDLGGRRPKTALQRAGNRR